MRYINLHFTYILTGANGPQPHCTISGNLELEEAKTVL